MNTEIIKNKARKHFPVCHHCGKPITDKTYILHHDTFPLIYHNRFECFKHRNKLSVFKAMEDDLQKTAIQFHILYQLNKCTWQELRR